MNVLADFQKTKTAFLGQKQRRNCEQVPKWSLFEPLFASFGPFFAKSESFFAKIERNGAVFDNFEKEGVVIAQRRKIRTYDYKNPGKFDKI